jgi:hypothetical protein
MMEQQIERLAGLGIRLLPAELQNHYIFERDGFIAMVERTPEGFGGIGSPGLLTPKGFAALIWRSARPYFVGKGYEQPATAEQVESLRKFASDLESALA